MKKISVLIIISSIFFFSCGESAEEKAKREQAFADSIKTALIEQAKADSLSHIQTMFDSLMKSAENLFLKYSIEKEEEYINSARNAFEKALSYTLNPEMKEQASLKLAQVEKEISNLENDKLEEKKRENERDNPIEYIRLSNVKGSTAVKLFESNKKTVTGTVCNLATYTDYWEVACIAHFYKGGKEIKITHFTIDKYIAPGDCADFKVVVSEPDAYEYTNWEVTLEGAKSK